MKDLRIFLRIKNNLILQRAEELWGKPLSIKKIAENCSIPYSSLIRYLSFKDSPVSKIEKPGSFLIENSIFYWTSTSIKIAKGLNCDPPELFPKHLREVRKSMYQMEIESKKIFYLLQGEQKSLEDMVLEKERKELLIEGLKTLNPREEKIIYQRFGINDVNGMTLDEVAKDHGISRERIRQIEMKALRKLRDPSRQKYFLS